MNYAKFRLGALAALVVLGPATALRAQDAEDSGFFVKVHGDLGLKNDEGQRNAYGVGFGANLYVGTGDIGLELNYMTIPGSTVQGVIPSNAFKATAANSSFDYKHTSTLMGLRISYIQPITDTWSWQIGCGVSNGKDKLATSGLFAYAQTPPPGGPNGQWSETTSTSGLSLQPYLGASWKFTKTSSLEFNLVDFMVKRQEMTPTFASLTTQYLGVTPTYSTTNINAMRLEVTYAFHF